MKFLARLLNVNSHNKHLIQVTTIEVVCRVSEALLSSCFTGHCVNCVNCVME